MELYYYRRKLAVYQLLCRLKDRMITKLMWTAINLQFLWMKFLPPFPFTWDFKSKRLYFHKIENNKIKFLPWIFIIFGLLSSATLISVEILVREILVPIKTLAYLNIFFLISITIMAVLGIGCSAGAIVLGDDNVMTFRELLSLEKDFTEGSPRIINLPLTFNNHFKGLLFLNVLIFSNAKGGNFGPKFDVVGILSLSIVSFFITIPWAITPLIIFLKFDPTYIYFAGFIRGQPLPMEIFIISFRFLSCLIGAIESCRIISFYNIYGLFVLKVLVSSIQAQKQKAQKRKIQNQFSFLACFTLYGRLTIISAITQKSFSFGTLIMSFASMILIVCGGYVTVAMRSIVPLPFYLIFPLATILAQALTAQVLAFGIICYESSCELLRLWKYDVLGTSNRKYMARKVKGMIPIRFYASIFNYDFYFMKKSTATTFFHAAAIHTMNSILLVPSTVQKKPG
jgi:hypothetical protein